MKEYKIKVNGNEYNVTVQNVEDNNACVLVNGTEYNVEVEGLVAQKRPAVKKQVQSLSMPTNAAPHIATAPVAAPPKTASAGSIKSPLPGVILDLNVKEGDTIKAGQRLLVLEAMKMENNIDSDRDGVISSIKVRKGDSVLEGDVLITIG